MKRMFTKSCLIVLLMTLSFWGSSAMAEDTGVTDDVRVNDEPLNFQGIASEKTSVVLKNGQVYAAWMDTRNFTGEYEGGEFQRADIYFAKFYMDTEGKLTGGTNVKVNDFPGTVFRDEDSRPALAVNDSGEIFVVWCDTRNIDNQLEGNDIYLAKSVDGGASFQSSIKLSPDTGFSGNPVIAVSDVNVYVAYEFCCTPAKDVLHLSISRDGGSIFAPSLTLVKTGYALEPSIAVDGDSVYIAYKSWFEEHTGEIKLLKSTDSGGTFAAPVTVNPNGMGSTQDSVAVAASAGNLFMVWRDTSSAFTDKPSGTIVMAASLDGGSTFPSIKTIIPDQRSASRPGISACGDKVAVSYTSSGDDVYGKLLYSRISKDAGASWSEEIVVSDRVVDRPDVGPSSISMDPTHACVLWNDGMGSSDNIDVYLDCWAFEQQNEPEECLPGLTFVSSEFKGCIMKLTVDYLGQTLCFEFQFQIETLSFELLGLCT